MKHTSKNYTHNEKEVERSIKTDMIIVKATLVVFGIVLNVCCFQLFL